MRQFVGVGGVIAVALSLSALAAEQADEPFRLTPHPETVAEQFLRTVEHKRFARGVTFLSSELQQRVRPDDLRAYRETLEQSIGRIEEIRRDDRSLEGETAFGVVRIETDGGEQTSLTFELTREDDLWKIASLPAR